MKKLFVFAVVLMASMSLSVFTSCDKDDDDFDHPLVGTWADKDYPDDIIIFKGDMTVSTTYVDGDWVTTTYFTYSIKENQLTLKPTKLIENGVEVNIPADFPTEFTQTFEINNGELTFSETDGTYIKK